MIKKILDKFIYLWTFYVLLAWLLSVFGLLRWEVFFVFNILFLFLVLQKVFLKFQEKTFSFPEIVKKTQSYLKKDVLNYLVLLSILGWALFAVISFAKIVVFPSTNWDSMTYHLTKITNANQRGTLWHDPESHITRVNFSPSNAEILNLASFAMFGDDVLIELPQFIAALFIPLAFYLIMRSIFGLNKKIAIISSLALLSVPLYWLEAITTQNDLLFILSFLISLLYVHNLYKNFTAKNIILPVLSIGLLIGTKYHGILAGGILGLIVIFFVSKNFKKLSRRENILILITGILSTVLAFPNYLIARLHYGSFLHQPPGTADHFKYGVDTFYANIVHFLKWFYSWDTSSPEYFSHDVGHMGLVFMVIPILMVLIVIYGKTFKLNFLKKQWYIYSPIIIFSLVFFFMHYPDDWDLRLFMLVPLSLLIWGIGHFMQIFYRSRKVLAVLSGILFLTVFYQSYIMVFDNIDYRAFRDGVNRFVHNEGRLGIGDVTKAYRPALLKFEQQKRSGKTLRIAYFGHRDTWVYPFYGVNWENEVVFVKNFEEFIDKSSDENFDYFVYAYYFKSELEDHDIPNEWKIIGADDYFTIYDLSF